MNINDLTMEPEDLSQEKLSKINGGNPLGVFVSGVSFVAAAVSLGKGDSLADTMKKGAKSRDENGKKLMEAGIW